MKFIRGWEHRVACKHRRTLREGRRQLEEVQTLLEEDLHNLSLLKAEGSWICSRLQ